MKGYLNEGRNLTLPATAAALTGGQALKVGSLFGIVLSDAAIGDDYVIRRKGVMEGQPKDTAAPWAVGDILYWDDTAKKFTKTATSNLRVGYAVAAALQADTVGTVLLGTDTI
jgi:predicted RecA/RadA family phage recombinase